MREDYLWTMYKGQEEKNEKLRDDLIRFYSSRLEKLIKDRDEEK